MTWLIIAPSEMQCTTPQDKRSLSFNQRCPMGCLSPIYHNHAGVFDTIFKYITRWTDGAMGPDSNLKFDGGCIVHGKTIAIQS